MKIRFTREPLSGKLCGENFPAKGEVREFSDRIATELITSGLAEPVAEREEQRAETAKATPEPTAQRRRGRPPKSRG